MKQIPLTQGQYALVDDADYEYLNQWKWFADRKRNTYYAGRRERLRDGRAITIYMHRMILGLTDSKIHSDHKDRNGLNNTKGNLRACTFSQNQMNRRGKEAASSIYKGVVWHKKNRKFQAQIMVGDRNVYLGSFVTQESAAIAYNSAAKKYFGEFANLNVITDIPKQLSVFQV